MPAIEVQDLTKRYGARTAVDSVSFSVEDGEIVGFLGPNGAGKTTTLRILTCFQPATSGTARVAGHDVFSQGIKVRESTGYLPESTPLYTEMRVFKYLWYRATLKGVPRRQRRAFIEEAMERCDVTDVRDRIIGHLSKGYRQRVGLADALVHRPSVLILDEPTSGLDPNQVRDVRDLIKEIAGQTTILFSTHTIPWVEQVCERVIVINQGRIALDGTLSGMRKQVEPWARVEFRTSMDARPAMEVVEAQAPVFFVENLTVGERTSLRYLTEKRHVDDSQRQVADALRSGGGSMEDVEVRDAVVEDLFTKLTRGSEQIVEVRS
jgi:ABC-2 type transport system ATP-binding protein